jgi:hypothetical protein
MATKEKPSFATETTMPACRSLSKIPFNFKQLHKKTTSQTESGLINNTGFFKR